MNQVNSLIGELPGLPSFSLSRKPKREQANAQMPTEPADGPIANKQMSLTNGQIELAERRHEKAKQQIERCDTSASMHPANGDWPSNLIATMKAVLDVPCPTRIAPEFIFELSDKAADSRS